MWPDRFCVGAFCGGFEQARSRIKTIEDVIGEVLLKVILGIVLKHHPDLGHRHEWNFDLAKNGIADANRERDGFGASTSESAMDILEVL